MILIEQLVKRGVLKKEKALSLETEIKNSVKKEEEVLIREKIVSEDFLFNLKSEILKIPLKREVDKEKIAQKVFEIIPEESARYYKMISLSKKKDILDVGMVYPEDLSAQEALKFLSRQEKFTPQVFLITLTVFSELIKRYQDIRKNVDQALQQLETELKVDKTEAKITEKVDLERLVEKAPIIRVVAVLLRQAVEKEASDIHIEPVKGRLRVRIRQMGILRSSFWLPLKNLAPIVARIKILASLKIDETRIPQDGRFSAKINEKDIDFRTSTFPTTLGEKVVIRILDSTTGLKSFKELGLERKNLEIVKKTTKKPYGLILATGPTGCGKSTTLYAILEILNKEGVNIITLEDPVEYFIDGVNQSQVKPEIGYTFATGLRHIVRQDPDIIMVGEIRDEETAGLAIHAALTGHLVLATLHTSHAVGAIPRLIDMKVDAFLLPSTLSIIIAQRLLRTLCPFCKRKVKPPKETEEMIIREVKSIPESIRRDYSIEVPKDFYIYEPGQCKKCDTKGFSGRLGIFEVLAMTDQLEEIILQKTSESAIFQQARNQGMITMKQDGILKVLEGKTTIEEVLRVAEEK
ncbi:MAG: GspE/PulE family protein [Candidatus Nealsonbacteria bacterium]|nr:GspE/PulE family protein [Candidatus Nealsonbacteria bacterium]